MTPALAIALAETLFAGITKIAAWLKTSNEVTPEDLAKFDAIDAASRNRWDDAVASAKARISASKAEKSGQLPLPFVSPDAD